MAADNQRFLASASDVTQRLAAAQPALASRLRLSAGVEVRSQGDLTLASDWNLMPASGVHTGGVPHLTLRAAGDLVVAGSLSDGFVPMTGATTGTAIAANGVPIGNGADIRLVGGADLAAADLLAVRSDGRGDVRIGRAAPREGAQAPSVFVRSTTGDIAIAAGGDIVQLNSQARVYTTGTPVDRATLEQFSRLFFSVGQLARGATPAAPSGPFYEHAGNLTLAARGDVIGAPGVTYNASGNPSGTQAVTDWWWRLTAPENPQQPLALWSRADLFAQGFASFGGGDITVRAGGRVVDLEASTPTTGYRIGAQLDADGNVTAPAAQRWFRGGRLDVEAGGDVLSGLFDAGGASARLAAGGAIRSSEATGFGQSLPVTQLFYGATDWSVSADRALTLGVPINPGLLAPPMQRGPIGGSVSVDPVDGLAAGAQLQAISLTGDLVISTQRPITGTGTGDTRFAGAAAQVLPDRLRYVALEGSLDAGPLTQRPAGAARLEVLARGDVHTGALRVAGADAAGTPAAVASADLEQILANPDSGRWNAVNGALAAAERPPVQVVSEQGDLTLGDGSLAFSARPLRLVAARDIALLDALRLQHEPARAGAASELSLVQAGRDIALGASATVRLGGPGDLLLVAGRDIELGGGPGIVTVGNQDNPRALPTGGANVSLLAGVDLGAGDYLQAVARGFQLVGGGLQNFGSALAVELEALRDGHAPLTGAALARAVKAFDALSASARRERVRTLVGAELFDRVVEQEVSRELARIDALSAASDALRGEAGTPRVPGSQFLAGGATLSASQVRTRLREALQEQAIGEVLAQYLGSAQVGAAARRDVTLAVSPHAAALVQYMREQGAGTLSVAQAAERFATLAPERQVLFLNQVMFAELRGAGRDATTRERTAYLRAYDALDALFPGARRGAGINLSGSQVKTQQGGSLRLVAPGGGVDVGELGANGQGKAASDLGLVTVAGGSIEAAVRENVNVNQSRVFTLARGDVLLWSSLGSLDAGRGAKTVTGSPPPLYTINDKGQLVVDTSGSFSGSGIAVLDAGSSLDLYAPLGEINAGDAGIQSKGTTFLGATRIVNADALQLSGPTVGAPPPAPTSSANASLGAAAQSATGAGARGSDEESEDDKRRKRRARRNLLLDFLGFGAERG